MLVYFQKQKIMGALGSKNSDGHKSYWMLVYFQKQKIINFMGSFEGKHTCN